MHTFHHLLLSYILHCTNYDDWYFVVPFPDFMIDTIFLFFYFKLFAESYAGQKAHSYWAGKQCIQVSEDPTNFTVDMFKEPTRPAFMAKKI